MDNKFRLLSCLILVAFLALATACQKNSPEKMDKSNMQIVTVTEENFANTLFYSGLLAPLNPIPVNAPVEGAITDKFFEYGDQVQNGQLLYKIKSTAEHSQFQDALTNYLKSKQELEDSKSKLTTTTNLYDQGIVPRNEFEEAQNRYYLNQLSYAQNKEQFDKELQKRGITKFPELSLKDIDKVKKEIESFKEQTENIVVYAPVAGMILFSKEGYSSRAVIGTQVKSGDILCYISKQEEGIAIKIKVNEVDVNSIHVGQKATVTGDAFSNITLNGFVQSIIKQASAVGSTAEFMATISVPELTNEQRAILHVGMSGKVALTMLSEPQILIPIDAVTSRDGKYYVKIFDPKTEAAKETEVSVGLTTESSIVINNGLKSGDKIVAPNPAEKRN